MICSKDSSYHVVKDICIDERAQPLNKILLEADSGKKSNPFLYNPFVEDGTDAKTEVAYNALVDSEDKKLSSIAGFHISVLHEDIDRLPDVGLYGHGGKLNSLGYNPFVFNPFETDDYNEREGISRNAFFNLEDLSSQLDNGIRLTVELSNDADHSSIKQCSEVDGGKKFDKTDGKLHDFVTEKADVSEVPSQDNLNANAIQENFHLSCSDHHKETTDSFSKNDEVNVEDEKSISNNFTSLVKSSESVEPRQNDKEQKDENGVIAINVSSGEVPLSSTDGSRSTDGLPLGQILSSRSSEVTKVDPTTFSARSSFAHLDQGDSSLSGPSCLSGRINYSGQIPYSGSISLRSESSTTSARSFAFPILQSEWSSSPVKMAKADRRNLRKHRDWRMRLICCRF